MDIPAKEQAKLRKLSELIHRLKPDSGESILIMLRSGEDKIYASITKRIEKDSGITNYFALGLEEAFFVTTGELWEKELRQWDEWGITPCETEEIIQELDNQFVRLVSFDICQYDKYFRLALTSNRRGEIEAGLYRVRIIHTGNAGNMENAQPIDLKYVSGGQEVPEKWTDYSECLKWFEEWIKEYYDKL